MVWEYIENIILTFSLLTGSLQLIIKYGRDPKGLRFFRVLYYAYILMSKNIYGFFRNYARYSNPLSPFTRLIHLSFEGETIYSETFQITKLTKGLFFKIIEVELENIRDTARISLKSGVGNILILDYQNGDQHLLGFLDPSKIEENSNGQFSLVCDAIEYKGVPEQSILIFADQTHSYISELLTICPELNEHAFTELLIKNKNLRIKHTRT